MSLHATEIVFLKAMGFTSDLTFYCVSTLSPKEIKKKKTFLELGTYYQISDLDSLFGKIITRCQNLQVALNSENLNNYFLLCLNY